MIETRSCSTKCWIIVANTRVNAAQSLQSSDPPDEVRMHLHLELRNSMVVDYMALQDHDHLSRITSLTLCLRKYRIRQTMKMVEWMERNLELR